MDLQQLRYFLRTVEAGSISRAAASLHLAQPSLSERLSALENSLGAKLLLRTTSGVRPTDIGLLVADRARGLLRGAENLTAEVRSAGAAPSGDVMVGLPASMALHLTVPLALHVREKMPGVNLRISEGMSGHILEWLLSGRLDLAVLYTADPLPQLDMGQAMDEELCLISRGGGAIAPIPLVEVAGLPLVLPAPDHGLRRTIMAGARAAGVALNVAVEVDSLTNLKRLAREGSLHTILPAAACREEVEAGQLVARPIVSPALRRPIVVVSHRERPLTQAGTRIRMVLEALVKQAAGQPEG